MWQVKQRRRIGIHHLLFNELGEEKLTGHVKHGLTAMNKFVKDCGQSITRAKKSLEEISGPSGLNRDL